MSVEEKQKIIESFHYWDARVTKLSCDYFADEVEFICEHSATNAIYKFVGCYKAFFDHVKGYPKFCPSRELNMGQIPYFLQDIKVGETKEEGVDFYTCEINMFPLYITIWCQDILVLAKE